MAQKQQPPSASNHKFTQLTAHQPPSTTTRPLATTKQPPAAQLQLLRLPGKNKISGQEVQSRWRTNQPADKLTKW